MDVFSAPDGQSFIWDREEASANILRHGIRFEQGMGAFLDPLAHYEDAGLSEEARQACIGLSTDFRLLYVVHGIRQGDVLRLISAHAAESTERRSYEDE